MCGGRDCRVAAQEKGRRPGEVAGLVGGPGELARGRKPPGERLLRSAGRSLDDRAAGGGGPPRGASNGKASPVPAAASPTARPADLFGVLDLGGNRRGAAARTGATRRAIPARRGGQELPARPRIRGAAGFPWKALGAVASPRTPTGCLWWSRGPDPGSRSEQASSSPHQAALRHLSGTPSARVGVPGAGPGGG
jgi:hypothetical protein